MTMLIQTGALRHTLTLPEEVATHISMQWTLMEICFQEHGKNVVAERSLEQAGARMHRTHMRLQTTLKIPSLTKNAMARRTRKEKARKVERVKIRMKMMKSKEMEREVTKARRIKV